MTFRRQQIDTDARLLPRPNPGHRRGERLQGVWVEVESGERLDARTGQNQFGPKRHPATILPIIEYLACFTDLDSFEGSERSAQQLARPSGRFK